MRLAIRLIVLSALALGVSACDRCGDFLGQGGKVCRADRAK